MILVLTTPLPDLMQVRTWVCLVARPGPALYLRKWHTQYVYLSRRLNSCFVSYTHSNQTSMGFTHPQAELQPNAGPAYGLETYQAYPMYVFAMIQEVRFLFMEFNTSVRTHILALARCRTICRRTSSPFVSFNSEVLRNLLIYLAELLETIVHGVIGIDASRFEMLLLSSIFWEIERVWRMTGLLYMLSLLYRVSLALLFVFLYVVPCLVLICISVSFVITTYLCFEWLFAVIFSSR